MQRSKGDGKVGIKETVAERFFSSSQSSKVHVDSISFVHVCKEWL